MGLLLNILLKRRDIEVMEVITQKEERNPIIGGRSIVLDIFAKDSEGKNYDVEVQRQDEGVLLLKRFRISLNSLWPVFVSPFAHSVKNWY